MVSTLIGAKLLKINDLEWGEVLKKCGTLVSAENREQLVSKLRGLLGHIKFLEAVGVNHNDSVLRMTLLTPQNVVKEVIIKAEEAPQYVDPSFKKIKHLSDKTYNYTLMHEHDLAYVEVGAFLDYEMIKDGIGDQVSNPFFKALGKKFYKKMMKKQGGLDFKTFFINAIAKVNQSGVHNVVIDLRYNGGGDLRLASEMFYLLGVDTIAKLGSLKVKVSDYFAEQIKPDFLKMDQFYRKNYGKSLPIDGSLVHFDSLEDAHFADFFHRSCGRCCRR